MQDKLKKLFGIDYSEDYLTRVERLGEHGPLNDFTPPFNDHTTFGESAEKVDFLLDERVISFFKVAPNQTDITLVLYNFSNEEVEVRWSPEFPCDNIHEALHQEMMSLDDDELVFTVKPQQLQWVCLEKGK